MCPNSSELFPSLQNLLCRTIRAPGIWILDRLKRFCLFLQRWNFGKKCEQTCECDPEHSYRCGAENGKCFCDPHWFGEFICWTHMYTDPDFKSTAVDFTASILIIFLCHNACIQLVVTYISYIFNILFLRDCCKFIKFRQDFFFI